MQTIKTKYHGPTNHRGPRISATQCSDFEGPGKRIFVSYDHELDATDNHKKAVSKLRDVLGWNHTPMIPGDTDEGLVWVFAPRYNADRIGTHSYPDPKIVELEEQLEKTIAQRNELAAMLDAALVDKLPQFLAKWKPSETLMDAPFDSLMGK